jgi:hypothetical protein
MRCRNIETLLFNSFDVVGKSKQKPRDLAFGQNHDLCPQIVSSFSCTRHLELVEARIIGYFGKSCQGSAVSTYQVHRLLETDVTFKEGGERPSLDVTSV